MKKQIKIFININGVYENINDLEVFYRVALLGKRIQKNVKSVAEYSPAEKSDILFYVLYAVLAYVLSKDSIIPVDIKNLNLDTVTIETIDNIRNKVYELYKAKGGNGRVAKSAEFINCVDDLLKSL